MRQGRGEHVLYFERGGGGKSFPFRGGPWKEEKKHSMASNGLLHSKSCGEGRTDGRGGGKPGGGNQLSNLQSDFPSRGDECSGRRGKPVSTTSGGGWGVQIHLGRKKEDSSLSCGRRGTWVVKVLERKRVLACRLTRRDEIKGCVKRGKGGKGGCVYVYRGARKRGTQGDRR